MYFLKLKASVLCIKAEKAFLNHCVCCLLLFFTVRDPSLCSTLLLESFQLVCTRLQAKVVHLLPRKIFTWKLNFNTIHRFNVITGKTFIETINLKCNLWFKSFCSIFEFEGFHYKLMNQDTNSVESACFISLSRLEDEALMECNFDQIMASFPHVPHVER